MHNDDRVMYAQRLLPFPPQAIYATFSSPDRLARWWGPEGCTNTFEIFEFEEGRAYLSKRR